MAPTVPIKERQVESTPLRVQGVSAPSVPQGAFGGGTERVFNEAAKIYDTQMQEINRAVTLEEDAGLQKAKAEISIEAQNRFKGKDGVGAIKWGMEEYAKRAGEVRSRLNGDAQKASVNGRISLHQGDLYNSLSAYAANETEKYKTDSKNLFVNTSVDTISGDYTNTEAYERGSKELKAALNDHYKGNTAAAEAEYRQNKDKIHENGIMNLLVRGEDITARKLYDERKGDISDTAVRTKIEKALEMGSIEGEAQRKADSIMADKSITRTSAYDEAAKIQDSKLRHALESELEKKFARKTAEEKDDEEKASKDGARYVLAGKKPPVDLLLRMSPATAREMQSWYKQVAKGEPVETDWGTYYNLKTMAATDPSFKNENLMNYRSRLGDTEFKELAGIQEGLRKGEDKADALSGYLTVKQRVDSALSAVGIDPTPKPGSDAAKKTASFQRQVDMKLYDLRKNTGKNATPQEVQSVIDDLLMEVVTEKGMFFDTKKRKFEIAPRNNSVEQVKANKPKIGEIKKGYRFKGGDPSKQSSWEKI